jgi:hypothetical protein
MAGLIPDGSAASARCCGSQKDVRQTYVPARWDQRANQLVSPIPGRGYPEQDDPDWPEEGHEDDGGDFKQAGPVGLGQPDSEPLPSVSQDSGRLAEPGARARASAMCERMSSMSSCRALFGSSPAAALSRAM